jgi:hypothetical protein
MANSEATSNPALSGRAAPAPDEGVLIEGSRVVPPDYGMPGTKGMASPIVPLLWLMVPFFFCVAYGVLTR